MKTRSAMPDDLPIGGPLPARGDHLPRAQRGDTAVEFAICAMAMVLIIIGFTEFGRLVWTSEVLQEAASEGARCMGLRANACAGVRRLQRRQHQKLCRQPGDIPGRGDHTSMVALSNVAICGGASGFSQVSITYHFTTVAPVLLTSLANGFTVPASACFPNSS